MLPQKSQPAAESAAAAAGRPQHRSREPVTHVTAHSPQPTALCPGQPAAVLLGWSICVCICVSLPHCCDLNCPLLAPAHDAERRTPPLCHSWRGLEERRCDACLLLLWAAHPFCLLPAQLVFKQQQGSFRNYPFPHSRLDRPRNACAGSDPVFIDSAGRVLYPCAEL